MTVYPKIKVNPAVDIDASVNLTSLGDSLERLAICCRKPEHAWFPVWRPDRSRGYFSPSPGDPGVCEEFVRAHSRLAGQYQRAKHICDLAVAQDGHQTPWMYLSIGYKKSSFGMGLWKHGCNRSSASFSMTANYGPFKINFAPYFARERSTWAVSTGRNEGHGSAQRHDDRRNWFLAAFGRVTYHNGPFVIDFMSSLPAERIMYADPKGSGDQLFLGPFRGHPAIQNGLRHEGLRWAILLQRRSRFVQPLEIGPRHGVESHAH